MSGAFCCVEMSMRKTLIGAVLAAATLLGACNTIEGAGRDLSSAGKAVADTARDAKN